MLKKNYYQLVRLPVNDVEIVVVFQYCFFIIFIVFYYLYGFLLSLLFFSLSLLFFIIFIVYLLSFYIAAKKLPKNEGGSGSTSSGNINITSNKPQEGSSGCCKWSPWLKQSLR